MPELSDHHQQNLTDQSDQINAELAPAMDRVYARLLGVIMIPGTLFALQRALHDVPNPMALISIVFMQIFILYVGWSKRLTKIQQRLATAFIAYYLSFHILIRLEDLGFASVSAVIATILLLMEIPKSLVKWLLPLPILLLSAVAVLLFDIEFARAALVTAVTLGATAVVMTIILQKNNELAFKNRELLNINNNLESIIDTQVKELKHERDQALITNQLLSENNQRLSNITVQLEAAREAADKANQEKSRFLSNMSHELRTPMHAIQSFIALSQKRITDDKCKNWLGNAATSAERLTNLLNMLLDLSKIESGRMQVNRQQGDLASTLRFAIDSLAAYRLEKNITFDLNGKQQLIGCFDETLLTQVIVNLVGNAIKYSPSDSHILLNLELVDEANQEILISCIDSGIGFPANEIDKAFDKYFQTSKTDTGAGGTGLGLAITKEIIELFNGQIWIESPPKGKQSGSAVHVQFSIDCNNNDFS